MEVDLLSPRGPHEFACTCLVTEILAPHPYGRIWLVNYLRDYQVDHERERRLQAVTVARALDGLATEQAGHVIVAGTWMPTKPLTASGSGPVGMSSMT